MDSRTAATLCMIDLSRLIDAGDFKQLTAAQDIIDQAMAPIPGERYRTMMLYRVGRDLGRSAPELPEADALRRAIQSTVRRQIERRFVRRRLTAALPGA